MQAAAYRAVAVNGSDTSSEWCRVTLMQL